eukprot:29644-Pelagococcus_subviridis.AAC.4
MKSKAVDVFLAPARSPAEDRNALGAHPSLLPTVLRRGTADGLPRPSPPACARGARASSRDPASASCVDDAAPPRARAGSRRRRSPRCRCPWRAPRGEEERRRGAPRASVPAAFAPR